MLRTCLTSVSALLCISLAYAKEERNLKMSDHPDSVISPKKVIKEQKAGRETTIIDSTNKVTEPGYVAQGSVDKNKFPFLSAQLNEYRKAAMETQKRLKEELKRISKKYPGSHIDVPDDIKSIDSSLRKLLTILKLDIRKLTDMSRGTIIFQSIEDLKAGLNDIKSKFSVLREVDRFDRPWEDGYRDMQLLIQDPANKMIAEVQLHLCHLKVFTEAVSHKIYEQVRDIKGQAVKENRNLTDEERAKIEALNKKSRKGYVEALKKHEEGDKSCQFTRSNASH